MSGLDDLLAESLGQAFDASQHGAGCTFEPQDGPAIPGLACIPHAGEAPYILQDGEVFTDQLTRRSFDIQASALAALGRMPTRDDGLVVTDGDAAGTWDVLTCMPDAGIFTLACQQRHNLGLGAVEARPERSA